MAEDEVVSKQEAQVDEEADLGVFIEATSFAKTADMPLEWNACAFCGAKLWIWPPHGFGKPCPIVKEMSDAQELRLTTERNQQIKAGQHAEAMMEFVRQHFEVDDD